MFGLFLAFGPLHISWSAQAGIHSGGESGDRGRFVGFAYLQLDQMMPDCSPNCSLSPHASLGLGLPFADRKLPATYSSLGELSKSGVQLPSPGA